MENVDSLQLSAFKSNKVLEAYNKNLQYSSISVLTGNESMLIFIDHISEGGNAIASVRLSAHLVPLYLQNQPTADLELSQVSRS